jgi:hypothetical protein
MGMKIDPNPYPNGVKTHRVSGTHCHLYTHGSFPLNKIQEDCRGKQSIFLFNKN